MSILAARYAESLLSLAIEENSVSKYKEEIDFVKKCFDDADVLTFFSSNKVSKQEKKDLIKNAFEGKLEKYIINFLYVLIDKGRIINYQEIFKEFHHQCLKELNIKEGVIETPRPLGENIIKELEEALSSENEKIELVEKINKSLISGFKISLNNRVIDNSMKYRINKMGEELKRKDGNLWN